MEVKTNITKKLTRQLIFYSLLCCIILAISCKKNDDDQEEEPVITEQIIEQVVVPAKTKVFDTNNTEQIVSAVNADGSLVLQNNEQTAQLATDDILILGVSEQTPMGLLRKVTGVTNSNGELRVTTTTATIEEAVKEGNFSGSFEIDINELINTQKPKTETPVE
ncbi:MAG: hypothetical protein AAFO69_17795, partial [Bacteroidota bacterium]